MRILTKWLSAVVLFLTTTAVYSQGILSGVVYDAETQQPLPGANVLVKGTSQGVSSDFDGKFTLKVMQNKGTLILSYISYEKKEVPFVLSNGKAKITVQLKPDAQSLAEVVVTGSSLLDIAKERQTPVAVSSIKATEIAEKLGNMEFPEMLIRTPSVYATKSGGGYGDSRINIRGFAQENIAVMVNGMPVNDMETGSVYWSNWSGLSDVTSVMQVQRGLGASKLAIASVGGTINIVTRSAQMKKGGAVSFSVGNNDFFKTLVSYNTGVNKKGWSSSILFSRAGGSTYVDGTDFEGYNYFFSLGYNPNEKHGFQFMITGAPQWHNQRRTELSIEEFLKRGSDGKPNRRYNADWGYLEGAKYGINRNVYHKPVVTLNWDWNLSSKTSISTVLYASFGKGFGTGDAGKIDKLRLSNFRDPQTGLYDFAKLVKANGQSTADKGVIIRRASVNSHDWYGFLSNFNHKFSKHWSLNLGIDGRYYYGYHHQLVNDLLGANSYKDKNNKGQVNYVSNTIGDHPFNLSFVDRVTPIENQITYSNDGEVRWIGAFGQLEYSSEKVSAFVQGAISNQGFQRIDHFLVPGTLAVKSNPNSQMQTKTGFKNLNGYNIKTGINYNISEKHNIFANVGYYSKQPFLNSVYPNYKNYLNPLLTNEKILGIEVGYGFKSQFANVNLNLYRTSWKDRFLRRRETIENEQKEKINAFSNILGITEIHQGVELEADVRLTDYLKLKGALSWGDWFYQGNAQGNLFNEDNKPIDSKGKEVEASESKATILYLDKVKVGDSAQKTFSLGANWTITKGLNLDLDWRYVGDLYSRLKIDSFNTQESSKKGALHLPSYNLFDLGFSYKTSLSNKSALTFRLNVNNLLDTYYIQESYSNNYAKTQQDFATESEYQKYKTEKLYQGVDISNKVFFGFGRTWNFSIRYTF